MIYHSTISLFEFTDMGIIYNQNHLAELYSSADIFIDSSEFQGFGRTALESMACGTACVLTNIGGVTEYAINEKNSLLVSPNKPIDIANAVVRLVNEPELYSKIVDGGKKTVQKFSHKIEAKFTHEYFKSLL